MSCPSCGDTNPEDATFCGRCGTAKEMGTFLVARRLEREHDLGEHA